MVLNSHGFVPTWSVTIHPFRERKRRRRYGWKWERREGEEELEETWEKNSCEISCDEMQRELS